MWPLTAPLRASSSTFSSHRFSTPLLSGSFCCSLELLGGSRLWCSLSILKTSQWSWMFCRQRVWGLLPFWAFLIYLALGVDLAKLFPLKSPNTQITWYLMPWTIRFDLSVGCSDGTMASSFLSPQASSVATALPNYRIVAKICCLCGVVVVMLVLLLLLFFFFCIYLLLPLLL